GIIWPVSVAPYHVIIVPIKYQGAVLETCDAIAAELEKAGVEVLLDDRDERAGVKFNDADLMGIPWRIVAGDKNLAAGKVEIKRRGETAAKLTGITAAAGEIAAAVKAELAACSR
ncbi:MAG: proline--tRNA ligase, partial [Treponema sp.]|nr:proline--tRNA ligase [Treponema sp.]